jgi:RimJ/RimL family protein N-acetyltransferase
VGQRKALLRAFLPPVVVSVAQRARSLRPVHDTAVFSPDLLSDGAVELRVIDTGDLDMIEQAARDPDIRRRWPRELSEPSEYLARYENASREGRGAALAICDVRGECFGLVTVELRDSGRAEIGYWLLPEGRGQGRATRALRLVSGWALGQLGIARLELSTSPDNVASQRVAERSGFQREGVLRSYREISDRREDAVFFSLLRDDVDTGFTGAAHAPAFVIGWLLDRAETLERAAIASLRFSEQIGVG